MSENEDEIIYPTSSASDPQWRKARQGSWSFEDIGEDFDEHVRRHVPAYDSVQQLVVSTAMWHCYEGARVLDVGCSTGLTLSLLATRSPHGFLGVGIDPVQDMIERAQQRVERRREELQSRGIILSFQRERVERLDDEVGFDVILALFALQFIPGPQREQALANIYRMLRPGGLFVLVEKTRGECAQGSDLFNGIYSDWKLTQGVKPDEIIAKWSSLRGRLLPWAPIHYEGWAVVRGLHRQLIWCWGPFRAWAFWRDEGAYPASGGEIFPR